LVSGPPQLSSAAATALLRILLKAAQDRRLGIDDAGAETDLSVGSAG
jgi:hypothetical protein